MSFRNNQVGRGSAAGAQRRFRNAFALALASLLLLSGTVQAENSSGGAPLDLNLATAAQLEALPGIGEVKAAAILAVRDARGGFGSLAELEDVRGIGPALATKLRPMLEVGPKSSKPRAKGAPRAPSKTAKK